MGWQDLLEKGLTFSAPWTGGRHLSLGEQSWRIEGRLPHEYGWYTFLPSGRNVVVKGPGAFNPTVFFPILKGYLVGDRLVLDVRLGTLELKLDKLPRVHLIEPGLGRFVRISASYVHSSREHLIYYNQEMPEGPEEEVLEAFLNRVGIENIKGVTPPLALAFKLEVFHRAEAERQRILLEQRRREEEALRALEEKRSEIIKRLGDGASRRELAAVDFPAAAKSALSISGAEYLDSRVSRNKREMVVDFRLGRRRYQCTCDSHTLQIIDSGICLTAHYDDPDFKGGTKGDSFLTLESLPSVIQEADQGGKLVIYRHVDGDNEREEFNEDE